MAEDFLTIREFARMLGSGQKTTCDLALSGQLAAAVKAGDQCRVTRYAFMHWVDAGGTSPVGDEPARAGEEMGP